MTEQIVPDQIEPTLAEESTGPNKPELIPFKMHPRIFQALGSELVTSDLVAVLELVKNSYDAFAGRVDVIFGADSAGNTILDVEDDGAGMTRAIIDDIWCTVATPFRELNPTAIKGNKTRRTTGAKGLGRLSAARLGTSMEMITRTKKEGAWKVEVDWTGLSDADSMEACHAIRTQYKGDEFERREGTRIRILGVKSAWDKSEIQELSEALSRLISPFEQVSDFKIFLTPPGSSEVPVRITPSKFLKFPPYCIKGRMDKSGNLKSRYYYRPFEGEGRTEPVDLDWSIVQIGINEGLPKDERIGPKAAPQCGSFKFDIRVWDLDRDSLESAESAYEIKRSLMRKHINAYKGLSLYRDGVLVLPKSDKNRDWLGLDLRRISRIGARLSTSQIVGYVSITADQNPEIEDTSDRERLAQNDKVVEFERILKYIVACLEMQRERDQVKKPLKIRDLFDSLSPGSLMEDIAEMVDENASAEEVMPLLVNFKRIVDDAKKEIEKQLVYYNRLATVGTISVMLIHEVGNNCGAIYSFIECTGEWLAGKTTDRKLIEKRLEIARRAVHSLETLAEKFGPLAVRDYQRGHKKSSIKDSIGACLAALEETLKQRKITVDLSLRGADAVRINPGELYPILYNLLDNASYWLSHIKDGERRILIETANRKGKVVCSVSDTGPGIDPADKELIFSAGVTRRPNGFGMGLTVAGELVENNGGKISTEIPGNLGGATFRFELLPL